MATKNKTKTSTRSFLPIDDWHDETPVAGSWLDNPFLGMMSVIGSVGVLLSISLMSSQADARRQEQYRAQAAADLHDAEALLDEFGHEPGFENIEEALAALNGNRPESALQFLADRSHFNANRKAVVQQKLWDLLATDPSRLSDSMGVFSIWFDTEDHPRFSQLIKSMPGNEWTTVKAMSSLPNPVPILIAELPEHAPTGRAHGEIKSALLFHGVHADEISRQLADRLLRTNDARQFERLTIILNDYAAQTSNDATLKKLISDAIVRAGQDLTPEQLDKMDWVAGTAIKMLAQPPDNSELLAKLVTTKHGAEPPQLSFGGPIHSPAAPRVPDVSNAEVALRLAREGKLPPLELQMLGHADSVEAQEFLWKVVLLKESGYRDLTMKFNETSLLGFSQAGLSLLNSHPESAIDSLWSVVEKHRQEITRERVTSEFLQALDRHLAKQLQEDIRPTAQSDSPASLELAEFLGGRQSALAIGLPAPGKVKVISKFKGLLPALIAMNQPETYETIVNAVINNGGPASGLDRIGEAIEPNFQGRLKVKLNKLEKGDQRQKRTIPLLIHALGQTGTSNSVPLLEELTKSKIGSFRQSSSQALSRIRQRTEAQ
ncbi:MAG: hypothetical protein NXI04_06875 [Planctomycetaceae bacterium]|nr:hypothetical protein [Planctomycetaceae bacterium]